MLVTGYGLRVNGVFGDISTAVENVPTAFWRLCQLTKPS